MDFFTKVSPLDWDNNASTWYQHTFQRIINESQSFINQPPASGNQTHSTSQSASSEYTTQYTSSDQEKISSHASYSDAVNQAFVHQFSPSTGAGGMSGTTPITITFNYTESTENSHSSEGNFTTLNYDTHGQTIYSTKGGTTNNGSGTGNTFSTGTSLIFTASGNSTSFFSSKKWVGYPQETTNKTIFGNWTLPAMTTQSYTHEFVTGPPTGMSTGSSWYIVSTGIEKISSQTVWANTGESIYNDEYFTSYITGLNSTGGIAVLSTFITTDHIRSPLVDTVIFQDAQRENDTWLGNAAWAFSSLALASTATTQARFTDLFASFSDSIKTLSDYQMFSSTGIPITAITISHNTIATNTEVWTVDGASSGWQTTGTTVLTTWKNGATWNESESYKSGSSILYREAESNYSSGTNIVNKGDISSSIHTITGTDTGYPQYETHIYHQVQETGYESGLWTSSMATSIFGGGWSEYPFSRLALHKSHATSQEYISRSGFSVNTLIESRLDGTGVYLGLVPTTTLHIIEVPITATISSWGEDYNPEIYSYETSSAYTEIGGLQSQEGYSKYEILAGSRCEQKRLTPQINYIPFKSDSNPYPNYGNVIHQRVPPRGYAGAGGNFETEDLAVYASMEIGKISGDAFPSQTLLTDYLPTAKAFDNVTFFPVRTDYNDGYKPNGMLSSKYIQRSGEIGDEASIAVTWSSTTTGPITGSSYDTYKYATYTIDAVNSIAGDFYSIDSLVTNSSDPRDIYSESPVKMFGGYGGGYNDFAENYTVYLSLGYAEWTEYSVDSSISTFSTSAKNGSVSFTVQAGKGIVFRAEVLPTAYWGVMNGGDNFLSSVQIFPS